MNRNGGQEPAPLGRPLSVQKVYFAGLFPGMNETVRRSKNDGLRLASRLGGRSLYEGPGFTQTKKAITESIALEVRNKIQLGKLKPVARCRLSFLWIEIKKNRDPDNIDSARKYIIDGIVAGGLIPGDGWRYIVPPLSCTWRIGNRYGVEVTVEETP